MSDPATPENNPVPKEIFWGDKGMEIRPGATPPRPMGAPTATTPAAPAQTSGPTQPGGTASPVGSGLAAKIQGLSGGVSSGVSAMKGMASSIPLGGGSSTGKRRSVSSTEMSIWKSIGVSALMAVGAYLSYKSGYFWHFPPLMLAIAALGKWGFKKKIQPLELVMLALSAAWLCLVYGWLMYLVLGTLTAGGLVWCYQDLTDGGGISYSTPIVGSLVAIVWMAVATFGISAPVQNQKTPTPLVQPPSQG